MWLNLQKDVSDIATCIIISNYYSKKLNIHGALAVAIVMSYNRCLNKFLVVIYVAVKYHTFPMATVILRKWIFWECSCGCVLTIITIIIRTVMKFEMHFSFNIQHMQYIWWVTLWNFNAHAQGCWSVYIVSS